MPRCVIDCMILSAKPPSRISPQGAAKDAARSIEMAEDNQALTPEMESLREDFEEMLRSCHYVRSSEIPDIDLYMDQVTTFMEQHLAAFTRNPSADKLLTKTMINNYAKNDVLIPPVRKKYGMDHMILLIFIFYLKGYLSIGDIARVLAPLEERYTDGPLKGERSHKRKSESSLTLRDIYDRILGEMSGEMERIKDSVEQQMKAADEAFSDLPQEDRKVLGRFDLICRMTAEIYMRQLFIERLIDKETTEDK